MYCSHCGKEINDDANFCKYCGADLSRDKVDLAMPKDEKEEATNLQNSDTSTIDNTSTDATSSPQDTASIGGKMADNEVSNEIDEPSSFIAKKIAKRKRIKRERQIQDEISLNNYTIKDEMVTDAKVLDKSRIELKDKGTLTKLKVKEIVLIVVALLILIASACVVTYVNITKKVSEDTMNGLVILGYFMFFMIFFALAVGVDRVYNYLTLCELGHRHITIKKYGFGLTPLALKGDRVFAIEITGDCDMCNGEIKGTYHVEWQNDELIAVCNFDRKHLYKIDINDIIEEDKTRGEEDNSSTQGQDDELPADKD